MFYIENMPELYEWYDHLDEETEHAAVEAETFLGRPVWYHCTICQCVQLPGETGNSGEMWEEASVAIRMHELNPQEVWWFQTLCGHCQPMRFHSDAI